MENRYYQNDCLNSIYSEYPKVKQQLVSMATGTGKTVVFSQLKKKTKDILPGQQLVLAHRTELIDQAADKLRRINPELKVDIEMAGDRANPNADIIVASVATLGRKGTQRAMRFNWDAIDKIVTDEAHHSTASSYMNIYEQAGILHPNTHKLLLGVTATPTRGDGKPLASVYKKIVYVYSMRKAIEDGWLVDVRGVRVNTKTSLDSVKTVAGDFAQDMLADAVNNPARNQLIVKAWLDHGENRQSIAFTVDIKHAQDLAEMFRHYNVKAEAIWGNDPDRADKLKRHKNGDITVLCNCGVLTEGYDDWRIGCVILARPTKSGTLFTQMVGRGTRLQEGTGNLKEWLARGGQTYVYEPIKNPTPMHWDSMVPTSEVCITAKPIPVKQDCIVLDVVDSTYKHSLVTLPTLMGLNPNLDLKGNGLVKSIQHIEQAQFDNPNVDFSTLKDIDQIQSLIESVNMFDFKFPPEVMENSTLSWHSAADGGFVVLLPNKEGQVKIQQNLLEQWEISAIIGKQKYKGIRNSLEEAFQAADSLITDKAWQNLNILKREAKWHKNKATEAQLNLLRKFYRGKELPNDLDRGKASQLISSFLAGKAK